MAPHITKKQREAIEFGHICFVDGALVSLFKYENGAPMFSEDGTMLDENGNRSIFDDIDE